MDKVFDQAITDFYNSNTKSPLLINNRYGPSDQMPLEVYFRDEDDLNGFESYAISNCRGSVLDVGAGVGALSLILQSKGVPVEALEISQAACEIMQDRGVNSVLNEDFFSFHPSQKYDTLLLMMNGIGITQNLERLPMLLRKFDDLLNSGGQVLFDSSDVRYLYENQLPAGNYYGEIDYQYMYDGQLGDWFKWLYVDIDTMAAAAEKQGYLLQVLSEDANGQYLGKLVRS